MLFDAFSISAFSFLLVVLLGGDSARRRAVCRKDAKAEIWNAYKKDQVLSLRWSLQRYDVVEESGHLCETYGEHVTTEEALVICQQPP
jgi:hypothetical protein